MAKTRREILEDLSKRAVGYGKQLSLFYQNNASMDFFESIFEFKTYLENYFSTCSLDRKHPVLERYMVGRMFSTFKNLYENNLEALAKGEPAPDLPFPTPEIMRSTAKRLARIAIYHKYHKQRYHKYHKQRPGMRKNS